MTVRFGIQVLLAVLAFVGTVILYKRFRPSLLLQGYANLCREAKGIQKGVFAYHKWEHFLKTHGAAYHFWRGIHPVSYLLLCGFLAVILAILGATFGVAEAVACAIAGAFFPALYLEYTGKQDNEEMLSELDVIYSALAIQVKAGVNIVDALAECYTNVRNARLHDALQALSGDIVMKADLGYSLRKLQGEFDNRYIDALCITLLQATESGQGAALLGDISDQIKDMQLIIQGKKKEKLNRSVTFYQLGIFALVLALTLYACVTHLFSSSVFFT